MIYNIIACGGTFDLLHKGHKEFLKKVLVLSNKIIIGVTSDEYILKHKPNNEIASFVIRKKKLSHFLKEIGAERRAQIVKINDMFGPLLDPKFKVDALAVTGNLRKNAHFINTQRINKGLKPLKVLEVPQVRTGDGEVISSSRIRKGEIDREGEV